MASASNKSFKMYRGDTKSYRLNFPYDVTGMVFSLTLKRDIDDLNSKADVSISTTAGDNTNDDPVNGIVYVTIPSTDSSRLSVAEYTMGIQKIIPGTPDVVTTLLVTTIDVMADVLQN